MAEPANELPAKSEEQDTKRSERSEREPFQTLRREIDRVFENFYHGLSAFGRTISIQAMGRRATVQRLPVTHRVAVVYADHDRDENWFLIGKALLHPFA